MEGGEVGGGIGLVGWGGLARAEWVAVGGVALRSCVEGQRVGWNGLVLGD